MFCVCFCMYLLKYWYILIEIQFKERQLHFKYIKPVIKSIHQNSDHPYYPSPIKRILYPHKYTTHTHTHPYTHIKAPPHVRFTSTPHIKNTSPSKRQLTNQRINQPNYIHIYIYKHTYTHTHTHKPQSSRRRRRKTNRTALN